MAKKEAPNRADVAKVTAALCPGCQHRGYCRASAVEAGKLWCVFCGNTFQAEAA